ncbi:MAG: NADH-quinone oxidoreductase subunit L [Eubacteriales bacterium]|nr:NADH-quinone oxidoreductase subunit L [Eubacteriales bacterium]
MQGTLLVCILTPLAGAFLLPLIGKRAPRVRNLFALLFVLTALVCSCLLLPEVLAGNKPSVRWELPLGLSFGFQADALAVFMAVTSSLVAAVIVVYSFGYIKEYDNQDEYYLMVVLFIGAMMGIVYTTNLILLYVFWEISAICCWRLIGFYRDDLAIARANKAFVVTVLGALIMLVGFLGIWTQTGTFEITAMKGAQIPVWSVVLILFGILTKSATFPLHSWLPDAGVAPSPVTSLLHAAVLVKIGVYAYARLFVVSFSIDPIFTTVVPAIAAVSALVSAGCAMVATDLKRIIAYSTISQLAFILLGISVGTETGLVGGMLYILAHSVAKGGLFLCAGILEHGLHTKDINQMGGLYKRFPLTAAAFALCSLSVMGVPPFSGYFAKFLVIRGAVDAGHPVLAGVFILGAFMTVFYLTRVFFRVFLGRENSTHAREHTPAMVASVVFLGVLALALGALISLPTELASRIWEVL